jgi:hypothetical protein
MMITPFPELFSRKDRKETQRSSRTGFVGFRVRKFSNRKERKEAQRSDEKSAFIRPIRVLSILQSAPKIYNRKDAKKRTDQMRNPPSSAQSAQSAFYPSSNLFQISCSLYIISFSLPFWRGLETIQVSGPIQVI